MPDFTIQIMQECINQECNDPKYQHQNGCWPYKKNQTCKHTCQWHELYGDVAQTEEQKKNMICPKCGGPTRNVKVAV